MSKTRNTSPTKRVLSILRISLCAALLCIFPFLLEAQNDLSTSIGLVGVDNASEQGCGYMNRIYVLQLENSGNSNLSGLQIDLPLGQANQLGDALIDIVDIEILGSISSYTPSINIDFDAFSDPVLMGNLAMNAGDQISVRIEIELDPSNLSLLSNTGIQAFAYHLNQATGSNELLDASDGGFLYEYTTWNQPGDTGGSDDPLVFDISYLTSQILSLNNNLNIVDKDRLKEFY